MNVYVCNGQNILMSWKMESYEAQAELNETFQVSTKLSKFQRKIMNISVANKHLHKNNCITLNYAIDVIPCDNSVDSPT